MSQKNQYPAERISAAIVRELEGFFERTKQQISWNITTHPKETFEQRKTAAAIEEIAKKSNTKPEDVQKLVNGKYVNEQTCRAICEVLIPQSDRVYSSNTVMQLMALLRDAPQTQIETIKPAAAAPVVHRTKPLETIMKPPAKVQTFNAPKGWSLIEEVVSRYAGDPEEIEKTILENTKKASKKVKCLEEEDGQVLVSKKYERWLLNQRKIKRQKPEKETESPSPIMPDITDKRHLGWRSASDLHKGAEVKCYKIYDTGGKDAFEKKMWGKNKKHHDHESFFATLVGDIEKSLECSPEVALEYAKEYLASLQKHKGDHYLVRFSTDMVRAALNAEDKNGNPLLKRRNKFEFKDGNGFSDIPQEEIDSLKRIRDEALVKRDKSHKKE